MADEVADLTKTLIWTADMVSQASGRDLKRIAGAYVEAQTHVAGIEKADGDARPPIVACFKKSDEYRATDDIARVGWILTALQERENEGDLPGWRKLRKVIARSVKALPINGPTFH